MPITGFCNNVQNPILANKDQPYRRLLPVCDREIITTRNTLLTSSGRDGGRSGGHSGSGGSSHGSGEGGQVGNFNAQAAGNVQCNTGNQLPNARLVSRTIHTDQSNPGKVNQFFPMFGQFVCHDFILTESLKAVANCCVTPGINDFTNCLPIIVPPGDSFFSTSQCLDFKRSAIYCNQTGSVRRHVNQLSAFVDAENIYGVDANTANAIRTFSGGKLKDTTPGHLLPRLSLNGGAVKYTAGEGRATENPALATVHTIFMREHNRVASDIAIHNSLLTDEQVIIGYLVYR